MVAFDQESRPTRWGLSAGGMVALFGLWYLAADVLALVSPTALPSPVTVYDVTMQFDELLFDNILVTVKRAGYGYVASVFLALLLGIALTAYERLREALMPLVLASNTVPRVALAPLIIFYLGDFNPHVLIAAWIAFFPMLINVMEGLGNLDEDLENLLDALDATTVQEYRHVRFPNALPFIFDGLKIGVTLAVVGAVVGEFVASETGVGFIALFAMKNYNIPLVFSVVGLMSLIAVAAFFTLYLVQDRLVHWREAALFPN
jgi:NitT/TauT family transport system permease protein